MKPDQSIYSVSILGYGNLGHHLAVRLLQRGVCIDQMYNRSTCDLPWDQVPIIHNMSRLLHQSDLYIISVADDAIAAVSEELSLYLPPTAFVCHTSGLAAYTQMSDYFVRRGYIYPLQSFSKGQTQDWEQLPIIIGASTARDEDRLSVFAHKLSNTVYRYDAAQKERIHLAAVLSNNFTNALVAEAYRFLDLSDISPKVLRALIEATFAKIKHPGPELSQTGPALRGDQKTMKRHIELLEDHKTLQAIYQNISRLIQQRRENETEPR